MDEMIATIRGHVKGILGKSGSHGMDHTERVVSMCRLIGEQENADMQVLLPAALLHDIARPLEKEAGLPHETEGARMAEGYLRSIHFCENRISAICAAIRTHRFQSEEKPESSEARILSDADKLDAMGAIGIARTFMRAAEHGGGIDDAVSHFHDKLLRLGSLMYTGTGRKIAGERHAFLLLFLKTLEREEETIRNE